MKTLYLAGPLFGAAERLHNLKLAFHLERLGYRVILPQVEAERFRDEGGCLDNRRLYEHFLQICKDRRVVVVANLDGADPDSGTAFEVAIKIASGGTALVYRTDIRTDPRREMGTNLMFEEAIKLYLPVGFTDQEGAESFYRQLAEKIDSALRPVSG